MATSDQQPTKPRIPWYKHDPLEVSVEIAADKLGVRHDRETAERVLRYLRACQADEFGRIREVRPSRPVVLPKSEMQRHQAFEALKNEAVKLHNVLREAVADGELTLTNTGKVTTEELVDWWRTLGPAPGFLLSGLPQPDNASRSSTPTALGSYQSPELRLAIAASEVFWGDWTPEKQGDRQTGKTIRKWLMGERVEGFPPNPTPVDSAAAIRIDALIRPPEAKRGGNLPSE